LDIISLVSRYYLIDNGLKIEIENGARTMQPFSQLSIELFAGILVAIIAGGLGFFYQLHRRRSRPFILIRDFSTAVNSNLEVTLPSHMVTNSSDMTFIERLENKATLTQIQRARRGTLRVISNGPELIKILRSASGQREFIVMTSKRQEEMESGNELRGRFRDRTSKGSVVLECISAGIRSKRKILSRWTSFMEEKTE
jgi:hypothetical protein